jgi:carotenoid cleavage dioxygenase-like enzyme
VVRKLVWDRVQAENYNQLWEMVIDPVAGTMEAFSPLSTATLPMEFPKVATPLVGKQARYVYTSAFSGRPGCQYFDALQRLDTHTGDVQVPHGD